jgi:kexin
MASGRHYSYQFGFGTLDAYEYVKAALDWKLVKPQAWIEMPEMQLGNGTMTEDGQMQDGLPIVAGGVNSTMEITGKLMTLNNFETLEHITVTVWISHHVRGDVEVELVSPNGIHSMLAEKRPRDFDESGFPGWTFMTLKHW